jgi:hypothetical protein
MRLSPGYQIANPGEKRGKGVMQSNARIYEMERNERRNIFTTYYRNRKFKFSEQHYLISMQLFIY